MSVFVFTKHLLGTNLHLLLGPLHFWVFAFAAMAPKAAKSKAKAKAKCTGNGKASTGEAKGWSEIQQGNNHMGKLGAQAVMDHLKSLAKCGKPQALATYKGLKGTQEKLEFALQLKVDREAAFLSVKENHAVETSTRDSFVMGVAHRGPGCQGVGLDELQLL